MVHDIQLSQYYLERVLVLLVMIVQKLADVLSRDCCHPHGFSVGSSGSTYFFSKIHRQVFCHIRLIILDSDNKLLPTATRTGLPLACAAQRLGTDTLSSHPLIQILVRFGGMLLCTNSTLKLINHWPVPQNKWVYWTLAK